MPNKTALVECYIADNNSNRSEACIKLQTFPVHPNESLSMRGCYIGRRGEGGFPLPAIDQLMQLLSSKIHSYLKHTDN